MLKSPHASKGNAIAANMDQSEERSALLFAFGDLAFIDPAITADRLYQTFVLNGIWLARRLPRKYITPMPVLFYQSGTGFRGIATLRDVTRSSPADWRLPGSGGRLFPLKLILSDVANFPRVINMREVLEQLSFVVNKTKWGQAVQNTPRIIPYRDLEIVRQHAFPS